MTSKEKAEFWISQNINTESKEQIQNLIDNDPKELEESFYKDLEFGTGGLRGVMGIGSNRMNQYTVGMATQGLANYLNKVYPNETISVAIAYDCRNNSRFFAESTARVFAGNGIKAKTISRPVTPYDIATTLANKLDLEAPSGAAGEPLQEVTP